MQSIVQASGKSLRLGSGAGSLFWSESSLVNFPDGPGSRHSLQPPDSTARSAGHFTASSASTKVTHTEWFFWYSSAWVPGRLGKSAWAFSLLPRGKSQGLPSGLFHRSKCLQAPQPNSLNFTRASHWLMSTDSAVFRDWGSWHGAD